MGKDNNQVWRMIFLITQIGITILTTIFLSMGIGYLIDRHFGSRLMVWFIILGVFAAFRSAYILIRRFISYNAGNKDAEAESLFSDVTETSEDFDEDDFRDI